MEDNFSKSKSLKVTGGYDIELCPLINELTMPMTKPTTQRLVTKQELNSEAIGDESGLRIGLSLKRKKQGQQT